VNLLGRAVGQREAYVNENAVVIESHWNCDGATFGLRHEPRSVLGESGSTEKEDGSSRIELHRKIVAGWESSNYEDAVRPLSGQAPP
jgi:hypothetical protein